MNRKLTRTLFPIVAGAGCMIAMLSAMEAVGKWQNQSPNIGDILVFGASSEPFSGGDVQVIALRPGDAACLLDAATLRHSGGSLVVERQIAADGQFLVHWAGERTADDAGTCGQSADLVLDRHQLDRLGSAAAGYRPGTEPTQVSVMAGGS
jgi:hypothetical protein